MPATILKPLSMAYHTEAVASALRLPPGVVARRAFSLFQLHAGAIASAGLARGDTLVVDAAVRPVRGSLVVCRSDATFELHAIRRDLHRRAVIGPADPEALPFPQAATNTEVVGTVVAVLRHGDGLQSASQRNARRRAGEQHSDAPGGGRKKRGRASAGTSRGAAISPGRRRANAVRADSNQALLERYVRELTRDPSPRLQAHLRTIKMQAARLATLRRCLRNASDARLYEALVEQINRVFYAMHRDVRMVGHSLALRRLPFGAGAPGRWTATALRPAKPLPRQRSRGRSHHTAAATRRLHELHAKPTAARDAHPPAPLRRF